MDNEDNTINLGSLANLKQYALREMSGGAKLEWHDEPEKSEFTGEPFDPGCGRYASQIPGLGEFAEDANLSRADYVRREEGTYNPDTNHFLCDACYITAGMPTSSTGWKCP